MELFINFYISQWDGHNSVCLQRSWGYTFFNPIKRFSEPEVMALISCLYACDDRDEKYGPIFWCSMTDSEMFGLHAHIVLIKLMCLLCVFVWSFSPRRAQHMSMNRWTDKLLLIFSGLTRACACACECECAALLLEKWVTSVRLFKVDLRKLNTLSLFSVLRKLSPERPLRRIF